MPFKKIHLGGNIPALGLNNVRRADAGVQKFSHQKKKKKRKEKKERRKKKETHTHARCPAPGQGYYMFRPTVPRFGGSVGSNKLSPF